MTRSSISQYLLDTLQIEFPIIQAPMAGTSTPAMAAAVSNAGGLGSLGVGAMTPKDAIAAIAAFRERSTRSLNVNVFCHRPATSNQSVEATWLSHLGPEFERFGAVAPASMREIYKSFLHDEEMFAAILSAAPKVVSFHFGVPGETWIRAFREAGIILLGTATSVREARFMANAGVHAVVAQGYEAGGHRGIFDPHGDDEQLGTLPLTRLMARDLEIPVIATGGIMDGAGIAAVLRLGAAAAQLGTAFIATHESAADEGYRAALFSDAAHKTVMTRAISGRPARCLANRFTLLGASVEHRSIPHYPVAYDAGKALHAVAKKAGVHEYGAHWAGQGAPLARPTAARELVATLVEEIGAARG